MDNLNNILGQGLPAELVAKLQEAFDTKVNEARELAETQVREELAQRYEHDKNELVEAMDRALTDVVTTYETQKAGEIANLREAQEKFHKGLNEAKTTYAGRLSEHVGKANGFVSKHLAEEVQALRAERASLAEARVKANESVETIKAKLTEAHNAHVKKIDEFVMAQVGRELNEFDQDRRALVETRAKLVSESRRKLQETQKRFVKEAASKLDAVISGQLATEVKQLHEDIERNRQNHFGRKMFEAVVAEFMGSHFAEGTETRKLQTMLEGAQAELSSSKQRLAESEERSDAASRKAKLSEERSERARVMSELLSNLRGEKRAVMEGMLDTVKTPDLRKSFSRFLPLVTETAMTKRPIAAPQSQTRAPLAEARAPRVVTGDQRSNRLSETLAAEKPEIDEQLSTVVRLAGIHKN